MQSEEPAGLCGEYANPTRRKASEASCMRHTRGRDEAVIDLMAFKVNNRMECSTVSMNLWCNIGSEN
jgi:hypothetical protein